MKRFAAMLFVPLLVASCGSSPAAPTSATPPGPRGTSLGMALVPDADPVKGWSSPMSLTLRASDSAAPVVIRSSTLRMLDEQGRVLVEATVAAGDPLRPGAYLSGDVVVQTLSWPMDQGYGKRIDGSLTFQSVSGDVKTIPISIPAR